MAVHFAGGWLMLAVILLARQSPSAVGVRAVVPRATGIRA